MICHTAKSGASQYPDRRTYPYAMPKSRTIIRLRSHLQSRLASHGISRHYKSHNLLFHSRFKHTIFASEFMRILCSNEQSKLCFSPTKSLLSDRNWLALPHGRGNFSKVGIPAEKTGNENFKGNETRHGKKNGKKAQE